MSMLFAMISTAASDRDTNPVLLTLLVIGLFALIAVAAWWMISRYTASGPAKQHDADWGDIPSDQIGL